MDLGLKEKTIFFQSLGCSKNLVDTEVMLGISSENDFAIVSEPDDASVIVINTCSFVQDSKKESIDAILEACEYKTRGKCERLIVTGCLPQRYKADLKVSFPEVDAFVGTGQYADLMQYIAGKREDEADFRHPRYIHSENTPRINSQPAHRAYLKISEGCMKHCSFCIIPKIRGSLRSRTIASLVEETRRLAESGVIELNLISQDLTDYGKDLGDASSLLKLLKALVQVDGIQWIRMFYVYPDELSDEFLQYIAEQPKICSYLDMPVQHINDRLLRFMNRKVTGDQIRNRIEKIRTLIPEVSLRSTLIAGYPSETEEEFLQLEAFVKEAKFDHLGVFAYSHEEGTASYYHPGQLPEALKEQRRDHLMALQKEISHKNLLKQVGKTLTVLLEKPSEEMQNFWQARHIGQAPDVDGCVLVPGGNYRSGQLLSVKIEKAFDYDLMGTPA